MLYATIDIETTGLNRYIDKITYIGIGLSHAVDEPFFKGYILDMSIPENIDKLRSICEKLKRKKAKTVLQMVSSTPCSWRSNMESSYPFRRYLVDGYSL